MKFKYKIFGQDTKIREGIIDDVSRDNVISKLQSEGNIIINVEETQVADDITFWEKFRYKIKAKDLVISSRQMSTLISGGVQILRAFRLLASEASNPGLSKRFSIIADDVQSGMPIYKALSRHPDIFDSFYISMVHSGEESGKLKDVLAYLADHIEKNYEIIQKTKKALTYPIFVVITFLAIMIIMTVFVLPKLANMLIEQGQELPTFTKIIMGFSSIIINYWWLIIPILGALFYYFKTFSETTAGKAYVDGIKLKVPALKDLYHKLFLSRFASNVNTMIASGVPIVQSLQITSEVVDNYVYKKVFERISEKVKDGKLLSLAMAEEPLIPNIMVQMTRIGEETGELGYMLDNLATFYKRELEQTIDSVIALIEPVMIVVLGISVGGLMASVLVPMYNVASSIQ